MDITIKKVLISDEIDDQCVKILQDNGVQVLKDAKLAKEKDRLLSIIPEYDALIVRSATKVTADVIKAGSNLKIIGRAGTGVDNIDCDAATAAGVIVMNTPGGNTMSAAEHTCALICSLSRSIPQAHESMRAQRWDRKLFMGSELYGKTLAIIGLGRIGREVAARMQSFGMTTIGFDPLVSAEEAATFNTEWLQVSEIWPRADYITVHVPLIPPTRNMINYETLKNGKKGVKVLNVARGGIIDEEGLLKAIEEGYCAGAALDVFPQEPPAWGPLHSHPKVILTPHLGASTVEAQSRVACEIAEQIVDLQQGKALVGAVNAAALANAFSAESQPLVSLGAVFGRILATQCADPKNATLKLELNGGANLKSAGAFITSALFSGLLGSTASLNAVSAPSVAKQLGIQASSSYNAAEADSISVTLTSNAGQGIQVTGGASFSGVLVHRVGDFEFPGGTLLGGGLTLLLKAADPLAAVQGLAVTQLALSKPCAGEQMCLVSLSQHPGDISSLKAKCSFVAQL